MRYEIDQETFAISMFEESESIPFLYQPNYPNNDMFESIEEATAWAEAWLRAKDVNELYYPPAGKDLEPELKPEPKSPEQVRAELGINIESQPWLLA